MKTVSKEEYQRRVELASPPSPVGKDCLLAFLFGGAICTLGQALCNLYQSLGLELPQARTGVSISLIFLSALLTALGLYDKIAQHAGAGTLVPITALPTPWCPRRWSLNPRALSTAWGPSFSPSRGRCWCTASRRRWCMGWCCLCGSGWEVPYEAAGPAHLGV